jgi:hypothetical protein
LKVERRRGVGFRQTPCVPRDRGMRRGRQARTFCPLDRMVRAVEKVRDGCWKRWPGIDYAVAGGNAVAAWAAQVDEGAVRYTRDVEILMRRADLERVRCDAPC